MFLNKNYDIASMVRAAGLQFGCFFYLLFLPSSASAVNAQQAILPVPSNIIYPGDSITDDNLIDKEFPEFTNKMTGIFDSRSGLVGKVARRTLMPGQPISASSIAEPNAVANGTKIRIFYESGALAISAYGIALQSGSVGEVVSVRNSSTGLTVSGAIQKDGSVRVGME